MARLPPLSEDEIARRLPVWAILSEAFQDTELEDSDYDRMARELAQSGYYADEVEHIYRREVAPAFCVNMLSAAGEWRGWPDDFIKKRVLQKRNSFLSNLVCRLLISGHIQDEWNKLHIRLVRRPEDVSE
ncbi:hypothetical protein [Erythrobacter sp. YT30]|uniref:DUF7079 family protein n=1 Tax=Erythrobacter sp. YT30 TaxID=1735012 RepID=UPI00076C4313|nr:hypothetical protein [Erythrobacter sp. YT30]KWV93057.1 hypothetical protein AUC45_02715 [Erythrobacter sp. YT30]